MKNKRKNLDEFFMKLAYLYSERSTCIRRKVGAVIVKDNIQIGGGYNGAPKGLIHCDENTCLRNKYHIPSGEQENLCRGCHAEMNAIAQAAKNGINIDNSILYCTTQPCVYCSKLIVNSGIKKIVYNEFYSVSNELINEILQNIEIVKMNFNVKT